MDAGAENIDSTHVRFFAGTATEQAYRVSRQIVGTALFLALCMWSFIGWSLWSEYSLTRATSRTQEFNLIAAFSGELTLTFDAVSNALRLIQNEIAAMPPSAPPAAVQARLERATRDILGLAYDICVTGPDGKVLYATFKLASGKPDPGSPDSGGPNSGSPNSGSPDSGKPDHGSPNSGSPDSSKPNPGSPDLGSRDSGKPDSGNPDAGRADPDQPDRVAADVHEKPSFIRHRDDANAGLIIDPPDLAAGGARTLVTVSRRLETADGQFAGEAILRLKPGNLINLQHEIDLGRRGMVAIAGNDGLVLAGFSRDEPDGLAGVGTDLRGTPYPDDLRPGSTFDYMRRSRVDGVDRLFSVRRLNNYPLNVLVGLDMDEVLGVARGHAWLISSVGVGATGLIAALTLLLVRELWRRTRREIELAADRERLQRAQRQIDVERTRLAETNRELVESKERAEVANRTKSQFLAHMSHELRTPLHAIIGFSELIRDQAPAKPGSPPIAGYAADILTSGRHLLDLINTILDITKIESGTATLTERLFPFADLARNALVSVRAQANAHHITLDLRLPETPLRLFADRTRLLQVLINLLANAVKFTPDDGLIILSVAFNPAGDVILSVIDSGIGMTEAEIAVALEPFGQVDNTLSRTFEGTGLGLPLACRLAELHGGRLELTSIKGRGTAARVTLPAWRVARSPD